MSVYLIKSEQFNLYKIGKTKSKVVDRLKQLDTGNPDQLQVICEFSSNFDSKLETRLHKYFKTKRIKGEWFELDEKDVTDFIKICTSFENTFKILKDNKNPFFK